MAKKTEQSFWEQIKSWFGYNHDHEHVDEKRVVKTCHGKDCSDKQEEK